MITLRTCANFNKEESLSQLPRRVLFYSLVLVLAASLCPLHAQDLGLTNAFHPNPSPGFPEPQHIGTVVANSQETGPLSPAAQLYRQLRDVGLDTARVYHIRDASIDREDLHFTLDDGTIGFTQTVDGQITGAFFEGDGEILLVPPDRVERQALGLFAKAAILEERFSTAYFRFNDDTAAQLEKFVRPEEDDEKQAFLDKWSGTVKNLAEADSLRLTITFLNGAQADGTIVRPKDDQLLRARIFGGQFGVFDIFFDTLSQEQISVAQFAHASGGAGFYNVWTSFPMRSRRVSSQSRTSTPAATKPAPGTEEAQDRLVDISSYKIKTQIKPDNELDCEATVTMKVREGGDRVLLWELSRYLKVKKVDADGKPLDFLQNEAIEGTSLARRGNDVMAVVFPQPLQIGQEIHLHFQYSGSVLADAGGGLMYVGARGIWYPNRGMHPANFDLEFRSPAGSTLVATGKRISEENANGVVTTHWISERPLPMAGFNLGQYRRAVTNDGPVQVAVYAGKEMERNFPKMEIPVLAASKPPGLEQLQGKAIMEQIAPRPVSPDSVGTRVSKAIDLLSQELGPYPYSSLALTQMPGRNSQGWPTLIFLSSYSFLAPEQLQQMKLPEYDGPFYSYLVPVHETAHQWWGDLVGWKSYRDQWLVEALANYSALSTLEKTQPQFVRTAMDQYREALLKKNDDGVQTLEAGPVTLGVRLYSSEFPEGYDIISYGRGTWLFHMLHSMFRDAETLQRKSPGASGKDNEDQFFLTLRKICQEYAGRQMTNGDVQRAFEENLPASLRFEGKPSLSWFFDEWVNGTAIPKLELSNVKLTPEKTATLVSGTILQKDAPQELVTSVPLYAVINEKKTPVLVARVFADGNESTFRIKAPVGTRKLLIDPYQTVLTRR